MTEQVFGPGFSDAGNCALQYYTEPLGGGGAGGVGWGRGGPTHSLQS